MKKLLNPISMILIGVVLTLVSLFILLAFNKAIPASKEYQRECTKLTDSQIKTSFIKSWFRTAAEGEEMDGIGLSSIRFETNPTFSNNSWSGELKVFGEKGHYSAHVYLDCYNGYFDYSGSFENEP